MKSLAALIAATLALSATASDGVTFNRAVTYTQPVTYAAGVTYLGEVTYADSSVRHAASAEPVLLEGLVVTPTHTYTRSEWDARMLARYDRKTAPGHVVRVHRQTKPSGWTSVLKSVTNVFN